MADAENNLVPHEEGEDLEDIEVDDKLEKSTEHDDDFDGDPADFISHLPPEVRRRVMALKKLQLDTTKLEASFYAEMHALEAKYAPLYKPIFEKRYQITTGDYEPTDGECDFPQDEAVASKLEEMKLEDKNSGDAGERVLGIPDFWLKIFRNVDMLECLMEENDVPIIKHLTDIKVELSNQPMGFKLHFHFSPNEYFKNTVLTKSYTMKCDVDQEDPFTFEGPEIIKSTGATIDWFPGKNVTVKVVKKKQKHKQRGSVRTVSKTVEAASFFNFFNPPQIQEGEEVDEEIQLRLTNDFEIGQYLRERIIPRAVLFYTGEALEDDDEEEYEEDDDEEEEDEDFDSKDAGKQAGGGGGRTRKIPSQSKAPHQQECKQQ